MKIKFLKSLWEYVADLDPLEEKLACIKEAGYDGFELYVIDKVPERLPELLDKFELEWSAQVIYNTAEEMQRAMEHIAPYKPVRFVAHGGRDRYSFDQGCEFFEKMINFEKELGIPIAHETHRHRLLYSLYVTIPYLERFPDLRLNADFSHWTVVGEYMMDDVPELMDLAASRSIHIHARVGHEEGPQVSDPRAPEWKRHVDRFDEWWDSIKKHAENRGDESLYVVPEYGPPAYMQVLPYTRMPVTDLWDICHWQAQHLRDRWNA